MALEPTKMCPGSGEKDALHSFHRMLPLAFKTEFLTRKVFEGFMFY